MEPFRQQVPYEDIRMWRSCSSLATNMLSEGPKFRLDA